ncbi:MAG: hypothetical protein JO056_12760 [Alphaproteobacteria bacterium]|nr:hypothetical protein [Alphaproteobacteria bacterium]
MAPTSPRERLTRLADLASRTDVPASELTAEVANLLVDWPATYPLSMREPFEALLEKSLHELDPAARTLLAGRFASSPNMPLSVLNALIFDATPEVRQHILACNAPVTDPEGTLSALIDEHALLNSIRNEGSDPASGLATHFGITRATAAKIWMDASGFGLAVLCKGGNCTRAMFSALAVLAQSQASYEETYRRLAEYDDVPVDGARALLQFWRAQLPGGRQPVEAAAEFRAGTAL